MVDQTALQHIEADAKETQIASITTVDQVAQAVLDGLRAKSEQRDVANNN